MSASHIYHSALSLSPLTSIIRGLYKQHASPFVRVVRGLSLSWEPVVATIYLGQPTSVGWPPTVVWSPCSKFIGASTREFVEVLDAVTLNRLATFNRPRDYSHLTFSPDSRSLTLFSSSKLISWDIQTGGRLSEIPPEPGQRSPDVASFTYSKDGEMVAVACKTNFTDNHVRELYTFDLPSRTRLGLLPVPDGQLLSPIWSQDEYLRFAIIHPGSITIWEVEFTLKHPPTQVESLPIPDEVVVDGDDFLFLPVLYRLAFTHMGTIEVWDVKAPKLLLKSKQASNSFPQYSFSSDGRFFAFAVSCGEVHIWKESPTGYVPHQLPILLNNVERPLLSPNGRSIIFPLDDTVSLRHTGDQSPSPPGPPTEHRGPYRFILAFSPNEKSAALARLYGNVVTILDLRSGDLRLTIDTGMEVECLGVDEDIVLVFGNRKIVTWNLPGGDIVRTVKLDGRAFDAPSLSPDLSQIVAIEHRHGLPIGPLLRIFDVPTGNRLASTPASLDSHLWFTPDGREVWTTSVHLGRGHRGWEIIEDGVSGAMELKPLEETLYPSRTFLWDSIRGYKVTDDGWVLSPTRKRLLWLPHSWREDQVYRLWSGRFLGLTHRLLSEVVILEFLE